FAEFTDQRLYRLEPGGIPEALTSGNDCFYADAAVDRPRRRLVCVRDDHRQTDREASTTLVRVSLHVADGREHLEPTLLAPATVSSARRGLGPGGPRLLWLAWRPPQMPWDGTELWVGDVTDDGGIEHAHAVAGGSEESIFQPGWSPDGEVYFVSDRSGWW